MLTKGLNVCLAMIVLAKGRADFFISLNIFSEFASHTEKHLFVAAGAKSLSQEYYF